MDVFEAIEQWLTGGSRRYRPVIDTMRDDLFMAGLVTALIVALLVGYTMIALKWRRDEMHTRGGVRMQALKRMRRTLLLGGSTGYACMIAAMFWPGWRLYAVGLAVVALLVWRMAWTGRDVKLLCRAVRRPRPLGKRELDHARADAQQKHFAINALTHDLKNPLHGLTLQTRVVEASIEKGNTANAQRALHLIRQCTREANELLDNFLELNRLDWSDEAPLISTFDLAAMLGATADANRPLAEEKGLTLEQDLPANVMMSCDRSKLERICQNLISNAIKYTESGKVVIRGWVESRSCILEVEDTGPGIDPVHQERLFEVFYRAHHDNDTGGQYPDGYGLGLAIVDRLVRRLGGHVDLDSTPGQGSCFRVVLPDTLDPDAPSTAEPTTRPAGPNPNPNPDATTPSAR